MAAALIENPDADCNIEELSEQAQAQVVAARNGTTLTTILLRE